MNNEGLWVLTLFCTLCNTLSISECFIPHYSEWDSREFVQDSSETSRTKAQQPYAACIKRNEKSMSENDPPYLRFPLLRRFCLLPFEHVEYTHSKIQLPGEEGKNDWLLRWLPANALALNVCLSFFLCALVCHGSSERLLYTKRGRH